MTERLPEEFFVGQPAELRPTPERPIGQGDVFLDVPVAGKPTREGDHVVLKGRVQPVMVVASSCGIRKSAGELNDVVHVAPINRLTQLAPGWGPPWDGYLHVLPLPSIGDAIAGEPVGANLARIGLCATDALAKDKRIASVTRGGMTALKSRLASYFIREEIPSQIVEVGAIQEWNELDLWRIWVQNRGSEAGFQEWLDEQNPNYQGSRRRTIYDDYPGLAEQIRQQGT